MKTNGLKKLWTVGLMICSLNVAFAADGLKGSGNIELKRIHKATNKGGAISQNRLTPEYKLAVTYRWGALGFYSDNQFGMENYRLAILRDEYKLKALKEDVRIKKKLGDKAVMNTSRRKLKKAKFDLFRDQLHFMVDREALKQDRLLMIAGYREELATDKMDLCKAKNQLNKAKRDHNEAGINKATKTIALKEKEIKQDKGLISVQKAAIKTESKTADEVLK